MKSIAHVLWGLSFGGIETMLINIANRQAELGAKIHIIVVNDMCEPSLLRALDPRIDVIQLHRQRHSRSLTFILRLNFALKKIQPDIVHLHYSCFYAWLFPAFRRKSCATLHNLPCGEIRIKRSLGKWFQPVTDFIHRIPGNVQAIDKISSVFAISQAVHDSLLKDYGVNSIVVNNGIIVSRFKQKSASTKNDIIRLIQVSRLDHQDKGQDLAILAVAKLIKAGMPVTITFIGEGSSLEFLKQIAAENQISDKAIFLGKKNQSYIAEHLCDYDIFVQPSRFEGFGLTVAEAMAANVPVLVADDQGPAEVTRGNTYGWTFRNGDPDAFAEQIVHIICNYEEAVKKAESALKYVAETYDVSITAKNYMELYGTITNQAC